MKYRRTGADAGVVGLTECGDDLELTVAFLGTVSYTRDQAEDVAALLESAAGLVRGMA